MAGLFCALSYVYPADDRKASMFSVETLPGISPPQDRILYVDDIEVARDTATNLESASGGLYIGAGKNIEPSTFWSGLIDDVRIYNRAVSP